LLLVLAVPSRRARVALGAVGGGVLVAAAASPAAFVHAALLFPTGLTKLPSPAATTTLGSVMIAPVGDSSPYRVVLTFLFLGIAVLVAAVVLLALAPRREVGAPEGAAAAAVVLLTLIVLAPVARAGYLVYPLDLIACAAVVRYVRRHR